MEQGYHNGGSKENKGLMENCVMPVVAGEKTLPNVTFSEKTRNKCKKIITKKMKAKIARDAKNKPAQ